MPRREADRLWAHQLQLTITDLVKEIHDTHHPISSALYYEDQRPAAKRHTEEFWRNRVPKFLGYFENVLAGQRRALSCSAARLATSISVLFQIVEGLRYAFPQAHEAVREEGAASGRAARPRC